MYELLSAFCNLTSRNLIYLTFYFVLFTFHFN